METKNTKIAARISGIAMFLIPAGGFAFEIGKEVLSGQGNLFSPAVCVSFVAVPVFGIPGLVVAAKGPLKGDVACDNRRTATRSALFLGLVTFAITVLSLIGWVTEDLFNPWPYESRWDAVISHLYSHMLACAALWSVLIALGLASLLSGRNLVCKSSHRARNDEENEVAGRE